MALIVYNNVNALANEGKISRLFLQNPADVDRKEYEAVQNPERYKRRLDELLSLRKRWESGAVELTDGQPLRYGAGCIVVLTDPHTNKHYLSIQQKDADAPRGGANKFD